MTINHKMSLDEAIVLLKNAVKESNVKKQPHIDLTLVDAPERSKYQLALFITQNAVKNNIISETELKTKLGLIEAK